MSAQKNVINSSKKKINSKNSKDDIILSSKDASLLEESISLVTTLSKEVGLVEMAKNKLQKDLSNLLNKVEEHEKKHINLLADKTFTNLKKEVTNQVEVLSLALSEQTKKQSNLQNSILKIKKEISNDLKQQGVNFSSLESHVNKLQKDLSGLKSLIERFENNLFAKKTQESLEIEAKFKNDLTVFKKELEDLKFQKDSENSILVEKFNQLVDVYENFEKKIKSLEKNDFKKHELKIRKEIENFEKQLTNSFNKIYEKQEKDLKKSFEHFKQEEFSFINLRLESFSSEIKSFEKKLEILEIKSFKKIIERVELIEFKLKENFEKQENLNLKKVTSQFLSLEKNLEKQEILFKNLLEKQKNSLEEKLNLELENVKKELNKISLLKSKERDELLKRLNSLQELYKNFEKKFKDFRKEDFEKLSLNFQKEVKKFEKLLLEDFSKAFLDFKSSLELDLNKQIKKISEEFNILRADHKDFTQDKEEEHKFIDSQLKALLVQVRDFEEQLEQIEIRGLDTISEKLISIEEKNKKIFEEKYHKFIIEVNDSIAKLQTKNIDFQNKNKNDYEKFKLELATLSKHFTKELDLELNEIKILTKDFQQEKSVLKKEIEEKINSEIKLVDKKILDLNELKKKEELFFEKKLKEVIDLISKKQIESQTKLEELFSKEKININENLISLKNKLKDFQQEISAHLEIKFEKSNVIFREEFSLFLASFEKELRFKEDDFLKKLSIIEKDKELMINELGEFKQNIAKLTQDFSISLNEKLDILESDTKRLEEEEQRVLDHIDSVVQVKLENLEDISRDLVSSVPKILEENRLKIENSENSFRNLFNEKICKLSELTEKKLNNFQKTFIDKNFEELELKADSKLNLLINLDKEVDAKQEVIREYVSDFDLKLRAFQENFVAKEDNFQKEVNIHLGKLEKKEISFENSLSEKLEKFVQDANLQKSDLVKDLQEKVELRLTNQEKQLNKRFLDLDSQFSSFKSVIVDEVEDTLKEITSFVNDKTQHLDKTLDKLNFVLVESSKKLKSLENVDNHFENMVQNIRDDVNDLRVKFEILGHNEESHLEGSSINSLVSSMSDYENQLIGLIESLKIKGFSDSQIKEALIQKGHPKIYVSMILSYL